MCHHLQKEEVGSAKTYKHTLMTAIKSKKCVNKRVREKKKEKKSTHLHIQDFVLIVVFGRS